MRVSVVLPTYRRPESLARCLDALEAQQLPATEIILVARADDTASREVANSYDVRTVLVTKPGVVAAMNAGLEASSGDVIALTDDDAAPRDDWLKRIAMTYTEDERIAAVGGRDWVYSYKTGRLIQGSARAVGTVNWFGRVTGNHHLGAGRARDVDLLKGVNLSVRGELLRQLRFDRRLRGVGTEHHWELSLCLMLRRLGYRIVYDPEIAVDHYPQPRVDDSRKFNSLELRDSTHNQTVALLEYLPLWQGAMYLIWASMIGSRSTPGATQLVRMLPNCEQDGWSRLRGAQRGLLNGLFTYWRSRGVNRPINGHS